MVKKITSLINTVINFWKRVISDNSFRMPVLFNRTQYGLKLFIIITIPFVFISPRLFKMEYLRWFLTAFHSKKCFEDPNALGIRWSLLKIVYSIIWWPKYVNIPITLHFRNFTLDCIHESKFTVNSILSSKRAYDKLYIAFLKLKTG